MLGLSRRACPRLPLQRRLWRYRKSFGAVLLLYSLAVLYQLSFLDFILQVVYFPYKGPLYVMYECDGSVNCGGLADKQKGIVGAYVLSQMMDRSFGIRVTSPCDISKKFLPNMIDWRMDPRVLATGKTEDIVFLDEEARNMGRTLPFVDFHAAYTEPVLRFTVNLDWTLYLARNRAYAPRSPLLAQPAQTVARLYRRALRELFSLAPALRDRLDNFKRKVAGQKLLCVHARVLNTNERRDWASRTATDVGEEGLVRLWDFISDYADEDYLLLLQSDSEDVVLEAQKRFPNNVVALPEDGLHDETVEEGAACNAEDKALLEQEALSLCDVVVLSRSDLGMIGTWLRDRLDNVFCLANYTVSPCPEGAFETLFPGDLW